MVNKDRQMNHLWRTHTGEDMFEGNRIEDTTNKAYKQRRNHLIRVNKALTKAIYHIDTRGLMVFTRAAMVLYQAKQEMMRGERGLALEKFHRACELAARIPQELEIIGKHLQLEEDDHDEMAS